MTETQSKKTRIKNGVKSERRAEIKELWASYHRKELDGPATTVQIKKIITGSEAYRKEGTAQLVDSICGMIAFDLYEQDKVDAARKIREEERIADLPENRKRLIAWIKDLNAAGKIHERNQKRKSLVDDEMEMIELGLLKELSVLPTDEPSKKMTGHRDVWGEIEKILDNEKSRRDAGESTCGFCGLRGDRKIEGKMSGLYHDGCQTDAEIANGI